MNGETGLNPYDIMWQVERRGSIHVKWRSGPLPQSTAWCHLRWRIHWSSDLLFMHWSCVRIHHHVNLLTMGWEGWENYLHLTANSKRLFRNETFDFVPSLILRLNWGNNDFLLCRKPLFPQYETWIRETIGEACNGGKKWAEQCMKSALHNKDRHHLR